MTRLLACLLGALGLVLGSTVAMAQEQPGTALVVGQARYERLPAVALAADSATMVGAGLRNARFQVRTVADLSALALRGQVEALAKAVPAGGGALIFFRGHVVQGPARDRSQGIDNWLLGVDEAVPGPGSVSLGDVLAILNAAGVARQVVVLDGAPPLPGQPVGFAQPGASSLRRSVVMLGAGPGEPSLPVSVLGSSLGSELANSNAPAGQLMLRVANRVETTSAGAQRPFVLGSGSSAQWVLNPLARPAAVKPDDTDVAMVKRYRDAIACGTRACLAAGVNAVRGDLAKDLERRLAALAPVDDFDPGAPARPATKLSAAQQIVVNTMAAEPWGRYRIGLWFLRGTAPLPQDDELAYTWLTEATKQDYGPAVANDPTARYREKAKFVLGWFHATGRAPATRDPERALVLWGGKYQGEPADPDTAWSLAEFTDRCVAGTNYCQKAIAQQLYARARAGGVTRARSPLDPDFPQEMPK